MKTTKALFAGATVAASALLWAACTHGAQRAPGGTTIDRDDIAGVVTGASGPEAGVWVIAETSDLPTKFARIVVTDDQGRYLLPDLPQASYDVWVRGYGLVDSPKQRAEPGTTLNLQATPAPNPRAAAEYYPAGYWFSLIKVPAESEFPGTGPEGNGINPNFKSQAEYVRFVKNNACLGCHQMGSEGTRELHPALGNFDSSVKAWEHRLKVGQVGGAMISMVHAMGAPRTLRMFADWTDRIAAGEVPPTPPRPQGIERNVVITMWDWADPKAYLHDLVSTDRRNPTVNANGPVYAVLEASADYMPVLDPKTHTASRIPVTVRDPSTPLAAPAEVAVPSPYWGTEAIWTSRANVHNPMLDEKGRVWITSRVRPPANPAFCKEGSSHPSARLFPLNNSGRHLAVYDPGTKEMKHVGTCFGTHHLMFAEDANSTLWMSGGGPVVGWFNTRLWDETGDEERAQGWTALVLDTNGNGRRDEYVEPNAPLDPSKDKRISTGQYGGGVYALAPAPDGSVWGTTFGFPGAIIRLSPGSNPPHTALTEVFEVPWDNPAVANQGFSPRGGDVDRNGVYWAALASGHMASFDRRKCRGPLNGPTATGQHCPEGWTFYAEPLPQLGNVTSPGSGEGSYYTWVDQFNTLGLGANVPINTGNQSEGLLVLKDGKWVVLRVPYPMGFYTKWLDGRIDDPDAGWKGRGLWASVSTRTPFHMEGGKGTTSKAIKFQLRPHPLAR
ncbi:MAG TPA: carboxypeptidase-like regulatory domain-containing protein [Longimicrobiaceae bacterium]|nr:carboxypeptidase-like regulatory domain-containing protein [Longimicrobiaceae bacterium]